MTGGDVYDPDEFIIRVMADRCETCIFRSGNPMYLHPKRVGHMVEQSMADPMGSITCHSTLPYSIPPQELAAICKGWWDGYAHKKFWSRVIPVKWWRL